MAELVVLSVDGRARCAVEVAAEASATELMAGKELVRYLERLGGASVGLHAGSGSGAPVRILVGRPARDELRHLPVGDLRDDGFLLHVSQREVALVGANDRGTLYAAYELIERLGGAVVLAGCGERVPSRGWRFDPADRYRGDQPIVQIPACPGDVCGYDGRGWVSAYALAGFTIAQEGSSCWTGV